MPRYLSSEPTDATLRVLGDALDLVDFGIVLLDRDLRVVLINDRYWEIWNIDRAAFAADPTFRELLDHAVASGKYAVSGATLSVYAAEREAEVRIGSVLPTKIDLADGRYMLFRCIVCPNNGRLLTYFDITQAVQQETSNALIQYGTDLRFSSETMESHAADLAALAEAAEENACKAEAARILLEHEISERQNLEVELRRLATTDGLTGTLNRAELLASAQRHMGLGKPIVVLMIDVDHFKAINDSYGHAGGDCALQQLVITLGVASRQVDILGRLGGEEFAIILPNIMPDVAEQVAERLRAQVAGTPVVFGQHVITMTVSVGLATQLETDCSIEQIIARADDALYRAKRSGRNCVVVHRQTAVA